MRETSIDCLLYAPPEPATQACALLGIELATFQVAGGHPIKLNHTGQGLTPNF